MGKKPQKYESDDSGEEDNEELGSQMDEEEEYQSNSDLIEEDSDEDGSSMDRANDGFGSKKVDYVKDSDVTDSDDSGEERGAEAVYHEQQRILNEDDFIDVDFANNAREKDNAEDDDAKANAGAGAPADIAAADAEERDRKERLIKKLSPEIMSLARELKVSMKEIGDKLVPLLEIKEAKRILQQKGNNYLEVRYELLLAYTICILFYLILKAKGKVTNNHPVLDALTKYKTHFDRMNVSLGGFYAQAAQILKKSLQNEKKAQPAKPLSFEEKMKQLAGQSTATKKKQNSNGKGAQNARDAKALQEELKNMQGFTSDEDDDMMSDDDDDMMSEDDEDIRITQGARAAAAAVAASAAPKPKKNNAKNADEIDMSSIEPWMLNDGDEDDDGDTLLMAPKKVDLNKMKQMKENKQKAAKSGKADAEAGGYEDAFYKQAKENMHAAVVSKKTQRVQEKQAKSEVIKKKFEISEITDEASRKITPQILHNKGTLIRKRKKIDGNAKLKNRMKYERKLKIHNRNYGGKIYEEKKQYYGEMGAIKSSLVKSTKL